MKIAIFHYHLNRGGVAQVIANQLRALDAVFESDPSEIFLFFGGRKVDWPDDIHSTLRNIRLKLITVPQLDYADVCPQTPHGNELAKSIIKELAALDLTTENCLLHFHNHNLGKNWAVVDSISSLQSHGFRMLLQIHDFAEDFRPDNYQMLKRSADDSDSNLLECLYPSATNVAFGVINQRDAKYLQQQGIQPGRINYVPNPVSAISGLVAADAAREKLSKFCQIDSDRPLLVYPVRGIRRKNIGEAILLTLLAEGPIQVGLTLPPINPTELTAYETWKQLSEKLRLPVLFELGQTPGISFPEIISAADQILTTSVAEGFGMAFLEGLAIGKPLIGRNIPGITADFVQAGIRFNNLYDELRVPLESVFIADYESTLSNILGEFYKAFGLKLDHSIIDSTIANVIQQEWIDFAKLPFQLQLDFVQTAFNDPQTLMRFRELNRRTSEQLASPTIDDDLKKQNQQCVADRFALKAVGQNLLDVYLRLKQSPQVQLPPLEGPNRLINCFLNPDNIFPSRFEKTDGQSVGGESPDWDAIILKHSTELHPIPTDLPPRLQKLDGIRVVLFDVYGTLLVSSSGDVGTDEKFAGVRSDQDTDRLDQMLRATHLKTEQVSALLKQQILKKHESLRGLSVPYPEIDIINIWKRLIEDSGGVQANETMCRSSSGRVSSTWARELALCYELESNPVYPMPGMAFCLENIRKTGLKLGIISNAQFYTPLILQAFCQKHLHELGFDRQLIFFSFIFGRAKPDQFMYECAAKKVTEIGCSPEQVLYVGNDMIKDIVPAKQVGFKSGLFAGDQRSLRLGQMTTASADLILTELSQIDECIKEET